MSRKNIQLDPTLTPSRFVANVLEHKSTPLHYPLWLNSSAMSGPHESLEVTQIAMNKVSLATHCTLYFIMCTPIQMSN